MQKRYMCIWFPHLLTDHFLRKDPGLQKQPFVVVSPSRGKLIITSANAMAASKGIYTAMSFADARALHPTLQKQDDIPGLAEKLLNRMAEWCIRFTPIASVDPLSGLILDISGCTHLFGSEEKYVNEIQKRFAEKGYAAKISVADTIGAAWALCRFSKLSISASETHIQNIRQLPPEALRIEEQITTRLHQLGLHTIGQLLSMKSSALRRRFGSMIIQRINQLIGTEEEFIQPVTEFSPFTERLSCLDSIQRIEDIEIAAKRLLQSICSRLQKQQKGLRTVKLICHKTDNTTTATEISTVAASANAAHLFKLLSIKLGTLSPEPGIELFILEALQTEDLHATQHAVWKTKADLHDSRITELIDRLSAQFGNDNIHRYLPAEHHLPERSFVKANTLNQTTTAAWKISLPRPFLLMNKPEPIEVMAPVPDYPPMNFRHKGKLHKIIQADGPERIEQEWFIAEGRHRDYYAVEDENGGRFWLFRSGHYDDTRPVKWFLHGQFA